MRLANPARVLVLIAAALSGGAGAAASPPQPIRIEMTEFRFRPSVVRLTAGAPVTLELVNLGQIAHQIDAPVLRKVPVTVVGRGLHIDAPGIEILRLQPGERGRLSFMPRARGRFRFACSIEGHTEAGMVGVLDVRDR